MKFPLMTVATARRGYAGQPGYVFNSGDAVRVTVATNLPQGGYFVGPADDEDCSIHIDTAELSEVVKLPDLDRPARFCRVTCGTGREFAVGVPPEIETALAAQAWMQGVPLGDFIRPEIRT